MSISQLSAYYAGREPYLKYPNENRDITLSGATSVSALTATGPAYMNSSLEVGGLVNIQGILEVAGTSELAAVTISSTLGVSGNATFYRPVQIDAGINVANGIIADNLTTTNTATFNQGLTSNAYSSFKSSVDVDATLSIINPSAGTDNQITTDVGGALLIMVTKPTILPTTADKNLTGLAIGWDIEASSGFTDFINIAQGGTGGFTFRTFNAGGIYQSLLSVVPNTLPVFTYGPVAYGHMIATGSLAFAYPSSTTASINVASGIYAYMINVPGPWTTAQASNATIMTTICNTNVGLGAVTCAVIAMPTMLNGYLTFQIQVINASHQAQECDFYYTVNAGNY